MQEGIIYADGNGHTLRIAVARPHDTLPGKRVPATELTTTLWLTDAPGSDAALDPSLTGPGVEKSSAAEVEYSIDLPGSVLKTVLASKIGQLVYGVAYSPSGMREVKALRVVAVKQS